LITSKRIEPEMAATVVELVSRGQTYPSYAREKRSGDKRS
jgi:hypothetical protein